MENTYVSPQPVIATAQTLTAGFVDLGDEIDVKGFTSVGIFLDVNINDSLDLQIRIIGRTESGGADDYLLNINSTSFTSAKIRYKTGFLELENDADQKIIIEIPTGNLIPFIQLQVKAGTLGASAGIITKALVSKSWK